MAYFFFSVSSYYTSMQPMDLLWIVEYKMRGFLGIGGTSIDGFERYPLTLSMPLDNLCSILPNRALGAT